MENPLELIILSNKGDKEAYRELLKWLASHSVSQIKLNLRKYHNFPAQSIDDIVQDVLITFHEKHQTFDSSQPLLPWINTIIRHKTIDFIRKKEFRSTMSAIDVHLIEELWSTNENEESNTEIFLEILESLPEDQCNLLKMAKIEGFSGKEIADKLHLSESNVKVLIHRAVKHLKKLASSPKYKNQ
jgi:RNA polymerase sigma-70 factor (ECF subfamily)